LVCENRGRIPKKGAVMRRAEVGTRLDPERARQIALQVAAASDLDVTLQGPWDATAKMGSKVGSVVVGPAFSYVEFGIHIRMTPTGETVVIVDRRWSGWEWGSSLVNVLLVNRRMKRLRRELTRRLGGWRPQGAARRVELASSGEDGTPRTNVHGNADP
jgi:hypothetical protein